MRTLAFSAVATAVIATGFAITAPASAAVFGFEGADLTNGPVTFQVSPESSFTFGYDAARAASFDPDTYTVRTTGSAQTSAFGGFLGIPLEPSLFRTDANILVDNNLFPSFAAFPERTLISNSLVAGDLGLRYMIGADTFFGFARLNGDGTLDIGFESQANVAINAGSMVTGALPAVPEPATWAMMIAGFGLTGAAMRRRRPVAAIA